MTLDQLIERLREYPLDTYVPNGFAEPHSYRGYYEQLAFTPLQDTTTGEMLEHAESAMGKEFEGYKGGEFLMTGDTPVHIARWGSSNEDDDSMVAMFYALDNRRVAELETENALLKTRLAEVEQVEPMTVVADKYAHRLALELECLLADKCNWDAAMDLIGEYRSAMNEIHEKHSPTFMGEPVLKEQP